MHLKFPEKVDNGLRVSETQAFAENLVFQNDAAHFHSADCGSGGFHRGLF